MIKKEKLLGSILGLAVADALGVPVEFQHRNMLDVSPVTDYIGYGTYNQPPGTWSDDTSLTLCLMDVLTHHGMDTFLIGKAFVEYMDGRWTPYGRMFDIGNATIYALHRMKKEIDVPGSMLALGKTNYGDLTSASNGSLMRIAPMAFYCHRMLPHDRMGHVDRISQMTHCNPLARKACLLYVELLVEIINGTSKNSALNKALATVGEFPQEFFRCRTDILEKLEEDEISSTGYVIDTLEAALWCFHTTQGYDAAVLKAVNLGGDTDTVGAITGALAGAYYGIDAIRMDWISGLVKSKEITDLCEKFYEVIVNGRDC